MSGIDPGEVFPTVHVLALRGSLKRLPGDSDRFEAEGLVRSTPDGFMLTEAGHRHHRALFERELAGIDIGLLGIVYERFPAVAQRLRTLESDWSQAADGARRELADALRALVDAVEPILRRSAELAPRFGSYVPRLRDAERRVSGGELEYAFEEGVESIGTVFSELHEDYLQTLGRGYEMAPPPRGPGGRAARARHPPSG
jgi:hypothetical protein